MSGWQYLSSTLLSIVATAATYLVMHHFVAPNLALTLIDVPQVVGLTAEQARGLTEPHGLSLIIDGQREPDSDRIVAGTLFDQKPLQGSRLQRGGEIHAMLALPVTKVVVPALGGQTLVTAQKVIVDLGLKSGAVVEVVNPTVPPGAVIGSDPPAGAQLHRGDAVTLQVSKGGDQAAVPSLRGRSLGAARQALEQAGLVVGDVRKGSDDNAADGVVLRQDPAPGTAVAKGQKVNLVIND